MIIKLAARIGTGLCLMILVWSCSNIPGIKDEEPGSFIRVPFVRVLLGETSESSTLGANHAFAIECIALGEQSIYYSSKPVKVWANGRTLTVENHNGLVLQDELDEVNIIPRGNDNRIKVDGMPYRGIISVLPYGQNVRLVNIVYMEDYLRGVVPPEIGKRNKNELEAVKAQAVAARTYAMAHLQQYGNEPYDMKSTIYDQVYEGVRVENKLVNRGIDETAGRVVTFQDALISAYYHSTCGGMTDNISHVWDRKEIEYLKATADSGACSWSKYYHWEETFTEPQLRTRVEQYLSGSRGKDMRIDPIQSIEIVERTPGGRVAKLVLSTQNERFRFYKDKIRWVFMRATNQDLILPSDRFDVKIKRDRIGQIKTISFIGSGSGHGVGMCQCGAIGYARQGWAYDNILTHYYQGSEVKKLY